SDAVRVWDCATWAPVVTPMRFPLPIERASLDRTGRRILVACGSEHFTGAAGVAQVVDLATGWPLTPPLWREGTIWDADFSPDGRRMLTTCSRGGTQLYGLALDDRPLEDLVTAAELLSAMSVDTSGESIPISKERLRAADAALRSKYPETF